MALIHVRFFSRVLGMCTACEVILPQRCAAARGADERLPVLWLLHGSSDDETSWVRYSSVERHVRRYGLAVVMPSVQLSRYADMAHGQKYFSFVADELPGIMRGFFPLSDRREDNMVAGQSMGGVGALRVGLSRPQNYAAIGCLSAGFSNYALRDGMVSSPARDNNFFLAYGAGDYEALEGSAISLARDLARGGGELPCVYQTCGASDYLRHGVLAARDFFRALPGDPFRFTFEEFPGGHEWDYWDAHFSSFLAWTGLPAREGIL